MSCIRPATAYDVSKEKGTVFPRQCGKDPLESDDLGRIDNSRIDLLDGVPARRINSASIIEPVQAVVPKSKTIVRYYYLPTTSDDLPKDMRLAVPSLKNHGPRGTRTLDQLLRRQPFYPS